MPSDDDAAPGKPPGGAKILFGADEGPRPRTAPPAREKVPRVLFPADPDPPPPPAPAAEQDGPVALFGSPQPPSPKGDRPKIIAGGSPRRRIPCTADDLRRLDPAATPTTVARALLMVAGTNLDDAYYDDVLRFGADLQAEHGAIAEQGLAYADAPALRRGQATLAGMIGFFGVLDPERVFAQRRSRLGAALQVLLEPTQSPGELFAATYPELLALAQTLRALESQLAAVIDGLRALDRRYAALIAGLASHMLAANFIVGYVREHPVADGREAHYRSQADALEARAASLLATRATVELGRLTNETLRGNAQALIDAGRGMLEEDLPAFHTAYTAALLAASQPPTASADPGWFRTLRDVHARVLLKWKGDRA